jgi:hypothetical protein
VVLSVLFVLYSLVGLSIGLALLSGKHMTLLTVVFGSLAFAGLCLCTYALAVPPTPTKKGQQPASYFYASLFDNGSFRLRWRLRDRDALAALPLVVMLSMTCCILPIAAIFFAPAG